MSGSSIPFRLISGLERTEWQELCSIRSTVPRTRGRSCPGSGSMSLDVSEDRTRLMLLKHLVALVLLALSVTAWDYEVHRPQEHAA